MNWTPLVSVVTIFLNAEKFIQEAIASVFAQTYDNWELILVDDGSKDRSSEIAQSYVEQNRDRVCYFAHAGHQNRGMSASRNLGIRNARGEYIAFLDADDLWLPYKLERQTEILASLPEAAMVYGASRYWHSWTGSPEDRHRDYIPNFGIPRDTLFTPPTLLKLLHPLGHGTAPCPSDVLVRCDVVKKVGGFEESFQGIYQLYEDQAFLAKIYLNAPVFVASECWDHYRLHPDSCVATVTRSGKQHTVKHFYLDWLENYFLALGIEDADLWKALRKRQRWRRYPRLSHLVDRAEYRVEQMKNLAKKSAAGRS